MLQSIFDALGTIVDFIISLVGFVIEVVKGLGQFVTSLMKIPELMLSVFSDGLLPPVFTAAIAGVVTVVILLRFLGRD